MHFSTCKLGIYGNKHVHIAIIHPLTYNKLVCHPVFNRHENFATSVILLRKRVFHFGITLLGVEQCNDKQRFPDTL